MYIMYDLCTVHIYIFETTGFQFRPTVNCSNYNLGCQTNLTTLLCIHPTVTCSSTLINIHEERLVSAMGFISA